MQTKIWTQEQVDKLRDCEVLGSDMKTWRTGAKFVRRGRQWVRILWAMKDGSFIETTYSCSKVRVDGTPLKYKPSYSFTNPKNPF